MKKPCSILSGALMCSVAFATGALAEDVGQLASEAGKPNPLKNAYFGEQHLHMVNMHHNVFFRDDKGPETQFSPFDPVKREDLWTHQEVQRRETREFHDPT